MPYPTCSRVNRSSVTLYSQVLSMSTEDDSNKYFRRNAWSEEYINSLSKEEILDAITDHLIEIEKHEIEIGDLEQIMQKKGFDPEISDITFDHGLFRSITKDQPESIVEFIQECIILNADKLALNEFGRPLISEEFNEFLSVFVKKFKEPTDELISAYLTWWETRAST